MTDRDLLEIIATQVGKLTIKVDELTTRVDVLTTRVDKLTQDMTEVKADLQFTKHTVVRIENDHGQKLGVLLNGYKQTAERLDRHEAIISRISKEAAVKMDNLIPE